MAIAEIALSTYYLLTPSVERVGDAKLVNRCEPKEYALTGVGTLFKLVIPPEPIAVST